VTTRIKFYTERKPSNLEWLEDVPTHWQIRRLKSVVHQVSELADKLQENIPYIALENVESWTGRVTSNCTEMIESKLKLFEEGDVLFGKLRPYLAKVMRTKSRGQCASEFLVFRTSDQISQHFLEYFLRSKPVIGWINSSAFGAKMPRTDWHFVGNTKLAVPSLPEQTAIADFLDHKTALIDRLIEKKKRIMDLLSQRIDALIHEAISDPSLPWLRFENLAQRIQRTVALSDHDKFVRLGLLNRGRGIFKKPTVDAAGMGDSEFFFVKEGDLILSGQFAWEGAVALATIDEEGCVVSHRYPVYRGKGGIKTTYLLGLLKTDFGDYMLNEASRGAAGRNRPLNTWSLGKQKIPVPATAFQEMVGHAVILEQRVKEKTRQSIALLHEYRASLITTIVTGQIDVSTWSRQRQTERHTEKAEEKFA